MDDQHGEAGRVRALGAVGAAPAHGDPYRDLFERALEPYLLTDAAGVIRVANARALQLFATTRDDVEGSSMAAFLHPDERAALQGQLERAATGSGIHAWEVRLAPGATEPRVLASAEPFTGGGNGIELRWVLWDAMPLELVRSRLRRLLEDSQDDAAMLRALAEWQASVLGSAAQDMRTPLSVISSTIDSLLEDGTSMADPAARALLGRASDQVMKLRRLLPTLLQLGRLQLEDGGTDRQEVAMGVLVDESLHDLGPLDREVTYQFEVDTLRADPVQLARVLVELVTHATEHGPPGARLSIGTHARGVDVELFLDVDGYEVPPDAREVMFSPFLGTGRSGGEEADGDTLGLSLVAVFARMHGGRAWVQDAPRGGASFRVLLSNALPDSAEL